MPYVETLDELAEWVADYAGVYNDPRCNEPAQDFTCPARNCEDVEDDEPHCHLENAPGDGYEVEHVGDCACRQFWVPAFESRMRRALANETLLAAVGNA